MNNKNLRFLNLQTSRMLANKKGADIDFLVKMGLWIIIVLALSSAVWMLFKNLIQA